MPAPPVPASGRHPRLICVSPHAGLRDWVVRQGLRVSEHVGHLSAARIEGLGPADHVVGMLPLHVAARICARDARYWHVACRVPPEARGGLWSADDMERFGAALVEYQVRRLEPRPRRPAAPRPGARRHPPIPEDR